MRNITSLRQMTENLRISNFPLNGHIFEYDRGDERVPPLIPKSVNRGDFMFINKWRSICLCMESPDRRNRNLENINKSEEL